MLTAHPHQDPAILVVPGGVSCSVNRFSCLSHMRRKISDASFQRPWLSFIKFWAGSLSSLNSLDTKGTLALEHHTMYCRCTATPRSTPLCCCLMRGRSCRCLMDSERTL